MKSTRLFKILALSMMIHFCGVSVYSYDNDTIVMESESDAEGEAEDSKKEHKIIAIHISFSNVDEDIFQQSILDLDDYWKVPHMEISNPPPEWI